MQPSPIQPSIAAKVSKATSASKASLLIQIRIPRKRRVPRFISPSTKGAVLVFDGPTKFQETIALTPTSRGCSQSSGATICKIGIKLLSGAYTGTISAYDAAPSGGSIPRSANLLSEVKNVPFTIVPYIKNDVGFTLSGVVASLQISGIPSGSYGSAFVSPKSFTVTAKDPDGNVIAGPYDNAVSMSSTDTHAAVATSGSDHPPAGKLTSSSDVVTLDYDGTAIASATIAASAASATGGSATFIPAPVLTAISAPTGLIGTDVTEHVSGHFLPGDTTLSISGTKVALNVSNSGPNTIDASFVVDAEAAATARTVTANSSTGGASAPQTFTVSNTGADVVTATGSSGAGSLRAEMLAASAGDTIVFDTTAMCGGSVPCTIRLSSALPPIVQNETIDGGQFGNVILDGASQYRGFWVETGTVAIKNLQIQNVEAIGGSGGGSGGGTPGGGGAGLGAGIVVNRATANVSIVNDYFFSALAAGGNGAVGNSFPGGGTGGGGLGGAGCATPTPVSSYAPGCTPGGGGGAGGGGVTLAGATPGPSGNGGAGADGGGGGGGAAGSSGGTGGQFLSDAAGGGGGAGASPTGGAGGPGGFGGGGGAGGSGTTTGGAGGLGGFGGGGGGGGGTSGAFGGAGGAGGPGGGGGAGGLGTTGGSGGIGGTLLGSMRGGNGAAYVSIYDPGASGGGAAAGPAIFVVAGTVTITNSGQTGTSAIGGQPGIPLYGSPVAQPGTADATPVFNYGGTVNGSTATGPISGALSNTAPSLRRPRKDPRRASH